MTPLKKGMIVWYWHEDRHVDQWNRIESPEINIYGPLISEKDAKIIKRGKIVFSTNGARDTWISTCERTKPHVSGSWVYL